MAKDKYISMKNSVSGFSFANLGLFTGFGNSISSTIYSLVLLEIFRNSATVGIYVSIYSAFCMIIALFANELFRYFSKAKIFYFSMLMLMVCYFMMGFSIKSGTFIALDYTSGIAVVFVSVLIPLFMSDFSKTTGMAKLNARYHLWLNVGALFAPMIAMAIAGSFGNRSVFFASAAIYGLGWIVFKLFKIVQEDKKIKKVSPRRTLRSIWNNIISFFNHPGMMRLYMVDFGYYALQSMRFLYVPIIVIEQGFSKETLGLILTLGIIPYVVLAQPMGRFARKYGNNIWMAIGFLSFAVFSVLAIFAHGWPLLLIFVLWQISGAFMEPIHDLLFFDNTKNSEKTKFYGVFKTAGNLQSFIVPLVGAGFITFFGGTFAVWIITAIISVLSTWVLLSKK
ncbi:MAG: MFS transporter [Alphaproteobacteria bacterium]|nr:MFS transporter [Alphaproteobacteria bacterium]MBN2675599.1 MFS transporter [Alphaproteobacteria bacterium]